MKQIALLFNRGVWGMEVGPRKLLVILMLSSVAAMAQSTVRGRVTDESGNGMPGVNVVVKSSASGTTTDSDGNYSLAVSDDAVLVFSFIGYESQEVSVLGQSAINVALQPNVEALTEVVVIGYGTQKKRDITGAVASLNQESLRQVPVANVVQSLQGRIAGLDVARNGSRPGAGGQIRIRGNRSLSGTNDPFIVLDGIPFSGSINDLNTDDIASIEVLKDASATAIYGSRGSNGVILITTKRGKPGKPLLTYNAYYGVTKPFGQYDMFNAQEFVAFRNLANYTAGYSAMEQQGIANGTDTDWQKVAYKDGRITNHELGLSGGTDQVTYGLSAGYFKEDGIITGQSFERFSLRSTIDAKIGKRVRVGLNSLNSLNYTNGEGVNPIYNIMRITPLAPVYNEDGSVNQYPMEGTVDKSSTMNPLTLKNRDDIIDRRRRIRTFNSLYGEVEILTGFKYRLNIGLDFRQDNRGTYTGPNTIMNPGATDVSGSRATLENGESWTATFENILYYEKTFAGKHDLKITGLYSSQIDRGFSSGLNGNGFPAGAVEYYNFNLATTATAPAGTFTRNGLVSYMGRVNYSYNGRYILTATFRSDGSNVFPVNKYLSYPAFAVGWNIAEESFVRNINAISTLKLRVGYGVTGNQGIPANATRGSLSSNRYNFGTDNVFGYYITSLPNTELRWEDTKQWNVGLDFGVLNGRITGSLELYKQKTDNLLVQKSLPRSNGVNSFWTNAASTEGKGIELNISSVNLETSNGFTWSTDFNIAFNRERILRLTDATTQQDIGNGWFVGHPVNVIYDFKKLGIWQIDEAAQAAQFGKVPGDIKLADLSGPEGKPDGVITNADRSIVGNFQPNWIGGLTNTFGFKNFDLSVVMFARMGGTLVAPYLQNNGTGTGYFGLGNSRSNQVQVDYWTPNNPTNEFPKPAGSSDRIPFSSTLGYYDASFVKVRTINFGYTIPASLVQRAGISSLRVYFTVQNPFLLYSPFVRKGLGFDPEGTGTGGAVQTEGANANEGVSARAITVGLNTPSTRQFIFGVNVKF